jgi:hypothetical protein
MRVQRSACSRVFARPCSLTLSRLFRGSPPAARTASQAFCQGIRKAASCYSLRLCDVEDRGLEPLSATSRHDSNLRRSADSFGTESGTVGGENGTVAPDLAVVVEAWPALSEADRAAMLLIVRQAAAATRS